MEDCLHVRPCYVKFHVIKKCVEMIEIPRIFFNFIFLALNAVTGVELYSFFPTF